MFFKGPISVHYHLIYLKEQLKVNHTLYLSLGGAWWILVQSLFYRLNYDFSLQLFVLFPQGNNAGVTIAKWPF